MGIFGEWYIHPGPPIGYDDYPRELVLTNGKREQNYIPERTCKRVLFKPTRVLVCSECGAGMSKQLDKYCYLHYCPNCGARVVDE